MERETTGVIGALSEAELKVGAYPKAPELKGIDAWIYSEPISLYDLRGKVVLVDFWTYSCINCVRAMPYLKAWHERYSNGGLVIIGVHTPEFFFEEKYENVKNAVKKYGVKFPVALDNESVVWHTFHNRYWPTKYLIDGEGNIRYVHVGEGGYQEIEETIRKLLADAGYDPVTNASVAPPGATEVQLWKIATPEIYFGYAFAKHRNNIGNLEGFEPEGVVDYKLPEKFSKNLVYIHGKWMNWPDHMEYVDEEEKGTIVLRYSAKAVYVVAGANGSAKIKIRLDGEALPVKRKGIDVDEKGRAVIKDSGIYNLVFNKDYGEHTLELEVDKGFKIYTLTFG